MTKSQKSQLAKDEEKATAIISGRKGARGGKRPAEQTFLSWSLKDALKVPQTIWDNMAGQPYAIMDIASKLKYSPTTGGFRELIRAAQRYGLTNETYTQNLTSTISLTPLGSSLVAPQPGEDVNALMRKALETPELFRNVLESIQGKVIPPTESLKNLLIRTFRLSQSDAEQACTVIAKNIDELGIAEDHVGKAYLRLDKLGLAVPAVDPIPSGDEGGGPATLTINDLAKRPPGAAVAATPAPAPDSEKQLPKQIFVAYGKNRKPLEQVIKILTEYKIPHIVAADEPNRGRPIGVKVAEEMQRCSAGIFIFTADEKATTEDGETNWRPGMNVVYELGAGSVLYGNRIVIFREEGVDFASDFKELGYIPFEKNKLDAKGLDLLKELGGLGIIKFEVA